MMNLALVPLVLIYTKTLSAHRTPSSITQTVTL